MKKNGRETISKWIKQGRLEFSSVGLGAEHVKLAHLQKELQLEGVSQVEDETAGQRNMGLKMHISH